MELFYQIVHLKNYRRKITDQKNKECYFENGCIMLKKNTASLIIIEEQGQFITGRYQHKTLNSYQWQLINDQQLQLSHLRYAPSAAELLATFNLTNEKSTPITAATYLCGQDNYTATLAFVDNKLILNWRVEGPQKALLIESTYFT